MNNSNHQKINNSKKNNSNRVYLYDSTLRDGAQTSTVNFSSHNKIAIADKLDELGIDMIEGGWPGANPTDDIFFKNLPKLKKSKFVAFGMTRKSGISASNDNNLRLVIDSPVDMICLVGKCWDFHLINALKISEQENLLMIKDSIQLIKSKNKEAIFDAEHFFDGYKSNPEFAIRAIKTAFDAGARWIVLCDTNGGTLPWEIEKIINQITKHIPGENLGIHCHNDTGNAIANSLIAVQSGVRQVQGTINGLGERCGNADLISIIPSLIFKMGFDLGIDPKNLVKTSRFLDEILNKEENKFAPYVGKFAFAHKGGLHVSAVLKNSESYEHIKPELVGNQRMIMISDQAGRSNIVNRLKELKLISNEQESNEKILKLVNKVKELEATGYAYDSADASFEILAKNQLSIIPKFYEIINFRVVDSRIKENNDEIITIAEAIVKLKINNKTSISASEGIGPVNALDKALKKALSKKYPQLKNIILSDYKVRILNPSQGTLAMTRVQIESQDKKTNQKWTTIGVSKNIIDASFIAMNESIIFYLLHNNSKS
jgi:2-isopropylmalate synthase